MGKGPRALPSHLSVTQSVKLLGVELAGHLSTTDLQSGLRRQGFLPDRSDSPKCGLPPELLVLVSSKFSIGSQTKYKALANH